MVGSLLSCRGLTIGADEQYLQNCYWIDNDNNLQKFCLLTFGLCQCMKTVLEQICGHQPVTKPTEFTHPFIGLMLFYYY